MSNLNLNTISSLDTGREVDVNRVMQTVDYVGGLVIDSRDTVIVDGDDRYVLASSTALPYTATGAGMPEGGAFVSVGDTVLRQELAGLGGAQMVAGGVVLDVDTVADLQTLPADSLVAGQVASVHGSLYKWVGDDWVPQGEVTPEAYGAVGDGVVDDGPALRAAIDALHAIGGGTLRCRAGAIYSCSLATSNSGRSSVIRPLENVHIDLNGSTIQTNDTVTIFNYNIVEWTDATDCSIKNGTLKGNKHTLGASDGEWGMGLGLYAATNCKAQNLHSIEQGGDGVYIGRGAGKSYCENIILENIVCDDNRRQGLSLISAKNLLVKNMICENTDGTGPSFGVDIEPNNNDEFLSNITFENLITRNNTGGGVLLYLLHLRNTVNRPSVVFNNYTSEGGDNHGLSIGPTQDVGGSVIFTGSTKVTDPITTALSYGRAESVNYTIDNFISENSVAPALAPIVIGSESASTYGCELLTISNVWMHGVYNHAIIVAGEDYPFMRGISINVRRIENAIERFGEIKIIRNDLDYANITSTFSPADGFYRAITSADSPLINYSPSRHQISLSIRIAVEVNVADMPRGLEMTLRNDTSTRDYCYVTPGSGNFYPSGSAGQRIRLFFGGWVRVRSGGSSFSIEDGVGYELESV